MGKLLYALLLWLPLAVAAQSKFFRSPDEARRATDNVAEAVVAGETGEALRLLRQFSSIPGRDFTAFESQITGDMQRVRERYGNTVGYELLREEKAGNSLLRLTYLIRHEWAAQRWVFVFYRGQEGWAVTDFTIDASVAGAFR